MGNAPVISPPIPSTAVLRAHARELIAAAKTLHLTQGESDALSDALLHYPRLFGYGVIPRHLDAMTSMGTSGPLAIRNVIIPPDQYGWELAYSHGRTQTIFYIPNRCGNVSVVRSRFAPPVSPSRPIPPPPLVTPTPALPPPTAAPAPLVATPVPATPWHGYAIPLYILGACIIADLATHKPWCGFGQGHGPGPGPAPHHPPHGKPTPKPHPEASISPAPPTPTPKPPPTPTPVPTPTPTACPSSAAVLARPPTAPPQPTSNP